MAKCITRLNIAYEYYRVTIQNKNKKMYFHAKYNILNSQEFSEISIVM